MKRKIFGGKYWYHLVGIVMALFILSTTSLLVEAKPNGPTKARKVSPLELAERLAKAEDNLKKMSQEFDKTKEKLGDIKSDMNKLTEKLGKDLESINKQISDLLKDKGRDFFWPMVAAIAGLIIILIALLAYWRKTYIKGNFPPIKK